MPLILYTLNGYMYCTSSSGRKACSSLFFTLPVNNSIRPLICPPANSIHPQITPPVVSNSTTHALSAYYTERSFNSICCYTLEAIKCKNIYWAAQAPSVTNHTRLGDSFYDRRAARQSQLTPGNKCGKGWCREDGGRRGVGGR